MLLHLHNVECLLIWMHLGADDSWRSHWLCSFWWAYWGKLQLISFYFPFPINKWNFSSSPLSLLYKNICGPSISSYILLLLLLLPQMLVYPSFTNFTRKKIYVLSWFHHWEKERTLFNFWWILLLPVASWFVCSLIIPGF